MSNGNNVDGLGKFADITTKESIKNLYKNWIYKLEIIKDENCKYEQRWSYAYFFLGGCAVLFSSASAIITFLDLSKYSYIPFVVTFISTASAFLLTFLDPSTRASKRKSIYGKSAELLDTAKFNKERVEILPLSDVLKEQEFLFAQYKSLLKDS